MALRSGFEGPLHPAADAVIIDTSNMTIDEVVLKIKMVIDNA